MCPALSHRCISLRDFASLSGYQSSVCCCTLLLPGLWTPTSHLSNCFSFIGLDFDFFFPQTVPSKVLRGSLYADVQARSLSPLSKPKKMWIPWKTHHKRHRAPLCTLLSSPWQAVVPNFGEGGLAGHFPLLSLEETVLLLLLLPGPRVDACVSLNSALTKSSTRMSTNELFTSFTKNGSPKRNVNLKGVTVFTAVERQHPTATTRNKAVT